MPRHKFFTVKGNGNFPFKLLYLDECFPASSTEAEKIALACPTVAPPQSIRLATATQSGVHGQLWREHGWPVQNVE